MPDTITPTQPFTEQRPWGRFTQFTLNQPTTVKILTVLAGQQFSLQYHTHRTEEWYVLAGTGTVTIGDSEQPLQAGHTYIVPVNTNHRVHADTDAQILELAYGTFDESDIVRLSDDYGRVDTDAQV